MIKNVIHLDDKARAKRLEQLTNEDAPTSLVSEIATLRLLEEEAMNNGNPRAAVEIIRAIGTLAHNVEVNKIRKGELMSRKVVLQLAAKFAALLADKIAGRFDGWEDALVQIREESQALIVDARNKPTSEELNDG